MIAAAAMLALRSSPLRMAFCGMRRSGIS